MAAWMGALSLPLYVYMDIYIYTECFLGSAPVGISQNLVCTKLGTVHQIRNPGKSCSENQISSKFFPKYLLRGGGYTFVLRLGIGFLIWVYLVPILGLIPKKPYHSLLEAESQPGALHAGCLHSPNLGLRAPNPRKRLCIFPLQAVGREFGPFLALQRGNLVPEKCPDSSFEDFALDL